MKDKKCIVFDFKNGKRAEAIYHYQNGQLDLDLNIEVMSHEPAYGSNVIEFKKLNKKGKKSTCGKGQVPFYTA